MQALKTAGRPEQHDNPCAGRPALASDTFELGLIASHVIKRDYYGGVAEIAAFGDTLGLYERHRCRINPSFREQRKDLAFRDLACSMEDDEKPAALAYEHLVSLRHQDLLWSASSVSDHQTRCIAERARTCEPVGLAQDRREEPLCQGVALTRIEMDSFEKRLVAAVKRKRIAEGLSLRGLSSAVGVSFSTLARIERGDGLPDNNSKIRLLEWLGPTSEKEGLSYDNVALVHFRAAKNAKSQTVRALLAAADCLKKQIREADPGSPNSANEPSPVSLSKEELESAAEKFRSDLGLHEGQPLDPLLLNVEGVEILWISSTDCIDQATTYQLRTELCDDWSAMSVPLDASHEKWAVLLNDCHSIERQRVTLLEEIWHILLGHKLTKIAKVAEGYGRTYDSAEEHDAYYLASATLLPRAAVAEAVLERRNSNDVAKRFGTSSELVEYRIKRLGLWREYMGKRVTLSS